MRHSISTDEAERSPPVAPSPLRPTSSEPPEPGDRFLGPSGRIWTVQAITLAATGSC